MEADPPPLSRGAKGKEAWAAAGAGPDEAVLILKTGAQWHMMPQCHPNYKTVHRRFQKWCRTGVLDRALRDLAGELRDSGRIDGSEAFIDASFARAKGGGPGVGLTKVGKGVKIMAIADRSGLPLSVSVHAANHHETKLAQLSLDLCLCGEPANLIGDKAWPHGTGKFLIYPESGKARGEGNGVVPIKKPCLEHLTTCGWDTETLPSMGDAPLRTGDLDAVKWTPAGCIGFEWETGNISSSHRALNKLLLTFLMGSLVGGFLTVPSNQLKPYLTDRIGNIGELQPYFPLWRAVPVSNAALRIVVVEHDGTSTQVPRIPKGKDGRAILQA